MYTYDVSRCIAIHTIQSDVYICHQVVTQENIDTSRDTLYRACITIQRYTAIQCIGCITTPQGGSVAEERGSGRETVGNLESVRVVRPSAFRVCLRACVRARRPAFRVPGGGEWNSGT